MQMIVNPMLRKIVISSEKGRIYILSTGIPSSLGDSNIRSLGNAFGDRHSFLTAKCLSYA